MHRLYLILISFCLFGCSSEEETSRSGPDTFDIEKVDIALIYENRIEGIPCLLYHITDTIKSNRNVGIVIKFDISYNNPTKNSGCCAIEPGLSGPGHSIDSMKILFENDSSIINVTEYLTNSENAQLLNEFEDYRRNFFKSKDYVCACYDSSELRLYAKSAKRDTSFVVKERFPWSARFEDIPAFMNVFNQSDTTRHYTEGKFKLGYHQFWLDSQIMHRLREMTWVRVEMFLSNGRKLESERSIINEL
ncbi:MAG: hypothetical protein ACI9N1_001618 [Flavobacteriales bacterium]|jgi:hypothetical protein